MGAGQSQDLPESSQRRGTLGPTRQQPTGAHRELQPALRDRQQAEDTLPASLFREQGFPEPARPPPRNPARTQPRRRYERDVPPVEYRPVVQQSEIVANVVNLKKGSLAVVQSELDPFVYLLEFEFDADVDGFVTVYYAASKIIQRVGGAGHTGEASTNEPVARVSYSGKLEKHPSKTRFSAGRGQKYRQKHAKGLDVRKFTLPDLAYKQNGERFPIVIRLEATHRPDSDVPEHTRVKAQSTFATLSVVGGVYKLNLLSQEVLVGGTIYRMHDLYGIGAGDVTASRSDEDSGDGSYSVDAGHECVICLTEPCNTAVLPCSHLCLCADCGRQLCQDSNYDRRRCPICRTQLGSLLRIISTPTTPSTVEQSEQVSSDGSTENTTVEQMKSSTKDSAGSTMAFTPTAIVDATYLPSRSDAAGPQRGERTSGNTATSRAAVPPVTASTGGLGMSSSSSDISNHDGGEHATAASVQGQHQQQPGVIESV